MSMKVNYLDFSDKSEITIVFQGDPHVGSKEFAEDVFKRDIKWAEKKRAYWINMGDALETATRNSVGAGVYEQQEIVQDQLDHYIELMTPLIEKGLFLGSHYGNHENRVYKESGFNLTKNFAKLTKTKYFGSGVLHYIRVGKQAYTMYTTHGHSGAKKATTKLNACIGLEKIMEAEIYAMAHVHDLLSHSRQFYRLDKKNKKLIRGEKHFIITGSYLDYLDSYGQDMGLEPGKIGSAKVTLYGGEKYIKVMV